MRRFRFRAPRFSNRGRWNMDNRNSSFQQLPPDIFINPRPIFPIRGPRPLMPPNFPPTALPFPPQHGLFNQGIPRSYQSLDPRPPVLPQQNWDHLLQAPTKRRKIPDEILNSAFLTNEDRVKLERSHLVEPESFPELTLPGLTLAQPSVPRYHRPPPANRTRPSPQKSKKRAYHDLDAPSEDHKDDRRSKEIYGDTQTRKEKRVCDLDFEQIIREELSRAAGASCFEANVVVGPSSQDKEKLLAEYEEARRRLRDRHGLIPIEEMFSNDNEGIYVSIVDPVEANPEFRNRLLSQYSELHQASLRTITARPLSNFVNMTNVVKRMIYKYMMKGENMTCAVFSGDDSLMDNPEVKRMVEKLNTIDRTFDNETEFRVAHNELLLVISRAKDEQTKMDMEAAAVNNTQLSGYTFRLEDQQKQREEWMLQQNMFQAFSVMNGLPSFAHFGTNPFMQNDQQPGTE